MIDKKRIFVAQPSMPSLDGYVEILREIWDRKVLTNGGPVATRLESELSEYLGVENLSLLSSGTQALMIAIRALGITGEVITTPFSFVATSNALVWAGVKPVFIDIAPGTFNMDPSLIEAAITDQTTAIMPVHCYGTPCDVDSIECIATKHGLKVIYDAAHAFGVECHCGTILGHGDASVLSFHATKVFSTFEGGAVITKDPLIKNKVDSLKNFGIRGETVVDAIGINGKLNEVSAAFGILQLQSITHYISSRKAVFDHYKRHLSGIAGLILPSDTDAVSPNYSYFPIRVKSAEYGANRDQLYERLLSHEIYSRRYFYPLLSNLEIYSDKTGKSLGHLSEANVAASEVLCLPIYPDLDLEDVHYICRIIRGAQ